MMTVRFLCAGLLVGMGLFTGCGALPEDDDDDTTPGDAEFAPLYTEYLSGCAVCHAPDAPGKTGTTEQTLDFSSEQSAMTSITTGTASGLAGNQAACNGVPFIGSSAETSLIVAVLDESVRQNFVAESNPDCDADAVSDMTLKIGSAPSAEFLTSFKAWVNQEAGAAVSRR